MVVDHRLIRAAAAALTVALWAAVPAGAAPFMQGPEKCKECHEAEFRVWEGTKHFSSFREVHKSAKAKDITAAVGGEANMKKNEVCTQCHYSLVQKDAGATAKADAGPSCESCHGASSDWFPIHNDYGGKDVKRDAETPEHKAQRYADAHAAGLLWPDMRYDVALNCMSCHGLDRASVDGATLAKMLAAGHPLKPEFELVQYSQGSVRHRFYPPDMSPNQQLDAAGLAGLLVEGAAAKLVTASAALAKSDDAAYQAAQQKRIDLARATIEALGAMPEAQALLADPSDANARALVAAIAGQDLSAQVGSLLPDPASYK